MRKHSGDENGWIVMNSVENNSVILEEVSARMVICGKIEWCSAVPIFSEHICTSREKTLSDRHIPLSNGFVERRITKLRAGIIEILS